MKIWKAVAVGNQMLSIVLTASLMSMTAFAADAPDPDANYDRLDGRGPSGKKVNVIEWEGNLEVHVYPAGSLQGLALKLDKKNKDKPVMVIGYRFDNSDKQLIRRAILGIDIREGFKAYRDTSADGYDKIVISNNGLEKVMASYKLDAEPSQLYPEGHPALIAQAASDDEKRKPAAAGSFGKKKVEEDVAAREEQQELQESGSIKPFFMREGRRSF